MAHTVEKMIIFTAGEEDYPLYRNPVIAAMGDGTVMAFTEARKSEPDNPNGSDWAASRIAARISPDEGRTWGPLITIDRNDNGPVHNPTPIADLNRPHTMHFLYQKDYNRSYYIRTDDSGKTWTPSREITDVFMPMRTTYDWRVLATGIGHGVMLSSGRLITPVWYARGETNERAHRPSRIGTVYSDDGGETWEISGLLHECLRNPSEAQIAELADGRLMMNIRNEDTARRRAISYSSDGGVTWSVPMLHPTLWEPICCGAMIKVPAPGNRTMAFTNPDSQFQYDNPETRVAGNMPYRHHLTVRLSEDDGLTWPYKRVLEEGISGYSDLAALADGTILSAYGYGTVDGNPFHKKGVQLARFKADWVKEKN